MNGAVMLSGALQRNAKHEARLSNISVPFLLGRCHPKIDLRFFAQLRMTFVNVCRYARSRIGLKSNIVSRAVGTTLKTQRETDLGYGNLH